MKIFIKTITVLFVISLTITSCIKDTGTPASIMVDTVDANTGMPICCSELESKVGDYYKSLQLLLIPKNHFEKKYIDDMSFQLPLYIEYNEWKQDVDKEELTLKIIHEGKEIYSGEFQFFYNKNYKDFPTLKKVNSKNSKGEWERLQKDIIITKIKNKKGEDTGVLLKLFLPI